MTDKRLKLLVEVEELRLKRGIIVSHLEDLHTTDDELEEEIDYHKTILAQRRNRSL